MQLCKSGQILNCCQPNALMTLKEYMLDYGNEKTRELSEDLIARELEKIPNEIVKKKAKEYISEMEEVGKRDFRF